MLPAPAETAALYKGGVGLDPHTAAISWSRRSLPSPCMVCSPTNTGVMPAMHSSCPTLDKTPAEAKESKGIFLKTKAPCRFAQENSRGCQAFR